MHAPIQYAISKNLAQVGYKPTYGIPSLRVKSVHRIVQMCSLVAYTSMFLKVGFFEHFAMAAVQTKWIYTQCIHCIFKDSLILFINSLTTARQIF